MLSRKKGRRDDDDNNLRETRISAESGRDHRKSQKDPLMGRWPSKPLPVTKKWDNLVQDHLPRR